MTIKLLTPQIANQIAAGEVVERPASVVKELLENAIDAGADHIEVCISKDTRTISITDNGKGIPKAELALALKRHATSKISTQDCLDDITTLGFRGEALASIAAASRCTLISRPINQDQAWQVQVDGPMQTPQMTPASANFGTTVHVGDLFEHLPVRRKFLKSPRIEFGHIEQVFKKIALANYDVAFSLKYDHKAVHSLMPLLSPEALPSRMERLLSRRFCERAAHINERASDMHIRGYYLPDATDAPGIQFFYVNGRAVRDKVLMHAMRMASNELEAPSSYVLFLTMDTSSFDVNVHPTKHEIRFVNAAHVHEFILTAIEKSRGVYKPLNKPMPGIISTPPTFARQNQLQVCRLEKVATFNMHGKLYVVDLIKTFKQVFNKKLHAVFVQGEIIQHKFACPAVVSLSEHIISIIERRQSYLASKGFDMKFLGQSQLTILSVPEPLDLFDLKEVFVTLAQQATPEQQVAALVNLVTTKTCAKVSTSHLGNLLLNDEVMSHARHLPEQILLSHLDG